MPELPEVQTIVNDLNNLLKGYVIYDVRLLTNYNVFPDKETFVKTIINKPIIGVSRVAKNIIIDLGQSMYLGIHLAMTGQFLVGNDRQKQPNWTRIVLRLKSQTDTKILYYTDMRMFGKTTVMNDSQLDDLKNRYGQEPIGQHANPENFHKQITSKRTSIKSALLDQTVISGLGNIYATDALFIAKIHPETPTQKINLAMATKLFNAAREILLEGIKHRGSTLKDRMYVDIYGKEGTHQNYFRVYGKEQCPNCSSKIEVKKVAGRGTYFCPNCQSIDGQKRLL